MPSQGKPGKKALTALRENLATVVEACYMADVTPRPQLPQGMTPSGLSRLTDDRVLEYARRLLADERFWGNFPNQFRLRTGSELFSKQTLMRLLVGGIAGCQQ